MKIIEYVHNDTATRKSFSYKYRKLAASCLHDYGKIACLTVYALVVLKEILIPLI